MSDEDEDSLVMDIRLRIAGYADEFRRGNSTFHVFYPEFEYQTVLAEIHIGFECPFTKKKEEIIYDCTFHAPSEVDNWFNRVIKVRPYLIRKINRIKRD
jgi:hypothetical protein